MLLCITRQTALSGQRVGNHFSKVESDYAIGMALPTDFQVTPGLWTVDWSTIDYSDLTFVNFKLKIFSVIHLNTKRLFVKIVV
jgi:hypothetical protein